MTEKTELWKSEYSLNTKQEGEALELLAKLVNNSVSLVFLDPPIRKSIPGSQTWLSLIFPKWLSDIKNIGTNRTSS